MLGSYGTRRHSMILSSSISALPTFSTHVAVSGLLSSETWNERFPSVNSHGIRELKVGSRSLRDFYCRKQGVGNAGWGSLKCQASGEVEADYSLSSSSDEVTRKSSARASLAIGSPVVVVEAPPLLKTAEPMPMMRPNKGLIKVGDAGRVIDRKPKDVWAVRFVAGAYLIDGKYFEPLLEE